MSFGFGFGLPSYAALASGGFNPASLFTNGEQGWVYDPSNLSTLFQDSAGTTPVTAMEQPVGLQLDLSRGLVLGSENVINGDFTSATGWTLSTGASISGGLLAFSSVASTSGATQTNYAGVADNAWVKVVVNITSLTAGQFRVKIRGGSYVSVPAATGLQTVYVIAGTATTFGIELHAAGTTSGTISLVSVKVLPGNHRYQTTSANRPVVSARVNLFVGTETLATQTVTTRATTQTLKFTGSGSITLTGTATGTYTAGTHSITTTAGSLVATVIGTVTQADIRASNMGVGLPAYQRVNTSTDYDTAGFPVYIKPNGSNQFMVTNSINFSATDKMTVWQGVRKLSDAGPGIIFELSAISDSNNGSFFLAAPGNTAAAEYRWRVRGTAQTNAIATTFTSPITNALTGLGDISGDRATLRVNGTQMAQSTDDLGTGNFGNYPAYFYARAGSQYFLSGHDYGSICRGAASTAGEITSAETWINQRTKAY